MLWAVQLQLNCRWVLTTYEQQQEKTYLLKCTQRSLSKLANTSVQSNQRLHSLRRHQVAEWLALQTSAGHEALGLNPAAGGIQLMTVWPFITQSHPSIISIWLIYCWKGQNTKPSSSLSDPKCLRICSLIRILAGHTSLTVCYLILLLVAALIFWNHIFSWRIINVSTFKLKKVPFP